MKIAWIHNFNRQNNISSGVFMYQILEACKKHDIEIVEFYTGRITPFNIVKIILRLRKSTSGFDIVHAQYGSACGFITSFLQGKKLLSLRGSDWYLSPHNNLASFFHTRFAVFMTRVSINRFDAIITMSDRMAIKVREKIRQKQVFTIVDGVDVKRFYPKDRNKERQKIGWEKENSPLVLFSSISTDNLIKRFDLANKAFLLAKETIPNLKLKMMTGFSHAEVPSYVSSCNVILLTSTHEGWPNIIKEGLASNIPFVSTDVSDLKSIALVEKSCTVVDETNSNIMVQQLAIGIINALKYPQNELNLKCHAAKMSLENNVNKLFNMYKKMCNEK